MTGPEAVARLRQIANTGWRDLQPAEVGIEMLEIAPRVVAEIDAMRAALEAAHEVIRGVRS